jgi:hypothetical protein
MSSERAARLSYEESCKFLHCHHHLRAGAIPAMPAGRPDIYGGGGVRFFRTWVGVGHPFGLAPSSPEDDVEVAEHALANLTLPRTFFGRSEISSISFQNTDLSESTLCWNDFIEVDFTDADLSGADLRASIFRRCSIVRANLRGADLRHSTFDGCDFTAADVAGAKLTRKRGEGIHLSDEQQQEIDWQDSEGEEPPGG